MKKTLFISALLLCPLLGWGANQLPHKGKYTPVKKSMYHKGWIDFNKNGVMDVYENPKALVDERIEDLLSQMTLEEKTCQMVTLYGYRRVLKDSLPTADWKNKLWKDGIGAIDEHLNGFCGWGAAPMKNELTWPASNHAWAINEVQRFFVEDTRLGIPVDFTNEGIRGVENYIATNFPTQLALGHTWNRDLINKVGYITGREARLLGYTNVYAPILDVGRDQRWGRYEEVYGESPYLVAELGIAMARGLQQDMQVASTAKHFIAYSNNKGAREGYSRVDPQMSPREVENVHAYTFDRVIREANILGVMSSYNDYDGFPIQSSYYWLMERLRHDMGFKGYVVSDSDAVEYLYTKHHTAQDMKESVYQSVEAGLNVRCTFRSPDSYVLPLRELVNEGSISMSTIDDRVRDILRVKFLVGMFDTPYQTDLRQADLEVNCAAHQEVALQASREGLVLLKNHDHLLPLDINQIKSIAVCGPNADESSFALTHYGPVAVDVTTVLQGIKNIVPAHVKVNYAKGCNIVDDNWPDSELMHFPITAQEQRDIDEAVAAARQSDVAVVVLGGGVRTCGENKSRSSIDLPGRQEALLQAIYATGKPVVLVLINGRPQSINWANRYIPSILEAWYPGSQGGTAIAEALLGQYNPGGKLTVTFPKTVGQIPFNFPAKPASQIDAAHTKGIDGRQARVNGPLYHFGYGLSYTTFEYENMKLSAPVITDQQDLEVSCTITNSGKMAGDEVVQLYIHDIISSVTTYEKCLRGFERVHLLPGESKEVKFTLHPRDFQLLNRFNEWVIEPGLFDIMIGASSENILLRKKLEITTYDKLRREVEQPNPAQYISASANTSQIKNVIDGKPATAWSGDPGEYLTFQLEAKSVVSQIAITWGKSTPQCQYEIQLSSGGGQFLPVNTGTVKANSQQDITFPANTGSDLRILIKGGKAAVAEVKLKELRKE